MTSGIELLQQEAYTQRADRPPRLVALYQGRFLPIVEKSVKAVRSNYEASKGSFLELLTAQRRLVEGQLMQQTAVVSMLAAKPN